MNHRERLLTTIRGNRADRVPLALEGLDFATRAELAAHPDANLRELAGRCFDHMAGDRVTPSFVNSYLVTPPQFMRQSERTETADGTVTTVTQIDTPKGPLSAVTSCNPAGDTTWQVSYPVESLEEIDCIRSVPWELPAGLRPPDPSQWPDDSRRRCISRVNISSPFVCVAGMMPYQYFLELCATELGLITELTEVCHRRTADVLDVLLAGGHIEYVWMGGCEWLTPPMASPQLYERLVQPFEADLIRRCHDAGALVHLHCHGNVRSTLELTIRRGADLFEPVEPPPDGDIPFAEAKELAAGRMTLGGNVEARILAYGTPDEVEAATRAAFEGTKRRMILRTSVGPLGPVTDRMLANYHRLIDVWEELSPLG